ncbi:protein unc-79 homolog isoform X3 [Stegodyphus dumicola]|uniref:protein unc-79 homolog isoform X3 n=1 Tax=Stegodyphus dumicola TaxID=202533 RepID=UPI0015A76273|nr:protein unc-79 homolog isoform X3 [Stegodyphus dumicola]
MGTRAAAFTAKIHNLQHYNARIKHNLVPLPSGDDVANTLKYFSQTLLSVLKDVPSISLDMLRSPEKDAARTSLFPSLDYKTLHNALVELVDAVPLVQHGAHALGYTILHTLACLVPFLEHELMDTLPYLVASTMTLFPCSLHKDIIDVLCNHLLPFTFREDPKQNSDSYASMSTAAVLMMIFQYTDCSAYHCQVLECLMSLKKDIVKDLLCVIAHGTAKARCHAVELLFQYLPTLNPALLDRKGIGNKLNGWKPQSCQRENCSSASGNEAVKMCFEHSVAITSGEHPPPLYMCEACAEEVEQVHGSENLIDVLLPMDKVSVTCEDPDCKATDKSAVATCFSIECAKRNGHRPIRYCAQCVVTYHNEEQGVNHMIHTTIPSPWSMDLETQSYMVEAVISLLREAEPLNEKHISEPLNGQEDEDSREMRVVEERQLLSRYGIWLLVGLCTPNENTPDESLGRLLSMLFQWFSYTACLPDDQAGNALERLKAEYIHGWLMEVAKSRFEVFVSCLLPHPVDYAKVGGHWESWPSYPVQIKEGFKRLLCLVPYDIITLEIWEYIMPYWMDAFRHEAIEAEFTELKILLSKILDPDLSPLGFNTNDMYKFLSMRFKTHSAAIQEQALYWLQILSALEVPVPLELLYDMFMNGVSNMVSRDEKKEGEKSCFLIPPPSHEQKGSNAQLKFQRSHLMNVPEDENPLLDVEYKSDAEIDLSCYILMLDILIKQLELQEVPLHKGFEQKDAQSILLLIRNFIEAPWEGIHTCSEPTEGSQCIFCEMCAIFYQLSLMLIEYFSPVMEVTMADIPGGSPVPDLKSEFRYQHEGTPERNETNIKAEGEGPSLSPHRDDNVSHHSIVNFFSEDSEDNVFVGHTSPIQTATVQECSTELDTVSVIPTETVVTAIATEVTLTEDDVAGAKCTVAAALLIDENESITSQSVDDATFWHTSEGKFKFTLEELPPQLQLFYVLLKDLAVLEDADVLYHILSCLKVMCLHSEVLNKAAHNHRGFLIWCQENSLIANLWKLLQMEFSHIAQLATALLLHSITLPSGSDIFWKIIEHDFHNKEWRARYAAVEKVTVIAHFVDVSTVKNSPLLQSALAGAFSYLVHSLDDEQPTISQRALLNLESIKTPSLKLFVWCLEVQFDCNVMDRPMILQTIFQIHNHLTNRRFLTWDFFLNRFDTLFLEDQIILERLGDISYVRDLKNTNVNSEMFQKKLKRAHESLSHTSSTRSLTSSFGEKMPYKRSASAPGAMLHRQDKIDKDKSYERQSSAPVLKRKSSRLVGSSVGVLGPFQHFPNSFFTDGHLKDTVQEETHFLNVLYRAMDTEENDKETLHLLIFLLMQFLSRPDPIHRTDDKITRSQHIVLRHLNILLGYSQSQGEGRFLLPPHKIRSSTVFSTFLVCMPKVLDYNFSVGNFLLTMFLSVLVCCPSPQKYPSEPNPPTYSLWLLDSYCRHSWLQSTLVIMYKYHYDTFPNNRYIHWLILIILNTLKAQRHRCKLLHEPLLSPLPSRSRDFNTPSADLEHAIEREKEMSYDTSSLHEDGSKPPLKGKSKFSPTEKIEDTSAEQQNQKQLGKDKSHQWKSWKPSERSCSSEGEDAEPELEAIPESPKSESSEMEHFASDISCYQQACVKMSEPCTVGESVIVTTPWTSVAEEAVALPNSTNVRVNILDDKCQNISDLPQSSISSEGENVSIIEKSSVEVMEKNIEVSIVSDNSVTSEMQNIFHDDINHPYSATVKIPLQRIMPDKNVQMIRQMSNQAQDNQESINVSSELQAAQGLSESRLSTYLPKSKSASSDAKEDLSRMKSLPHETYKHQNVCRSKTDSNILDLPYSDDNKVSHSRYPHSKLMQSKRNTQTKLSRKAEILSSENLTVPIFRPPLERLLPIGLPEKEKPKRSDSLSVAHHYEPDLGLLQPSMSYDQTPLRDMSVTRDFCEDKGVQTGNLDPVFDIPAQERLLPVGPLPSKKDAFPPISKPTVELIPKLSLKSIANEDVSSLQGAAKLDQVEKVNDNILIKFEEDGSDTKKGAISSELKMLNKSKESGHFDTKSKGESDAPGKRISVESEGSALGAMASENFMNRFFDLTPDISQPTSAFGVFDVCKSAMDMNNEESTSQEKKQIENGDHRNSSSSMDLLSNEKIEPSILSHENIIQKSLEKAFEDDIKCRLPYKQRKQRKSGLSTLEAQRSFDYQNASARRLRKVEMGSISSIGLASKRSSTSQSLYPRCGDDMVIERCTECGAVLEEYSDEEIGLCIVILSTFVHREAAMAAPLLPNMLRVVARIASSPSYPWQTESNIHLPGGSVSIARQFLRCTLHQLAPNGVFVQIFQSHVIEPEFYKTMASALADFTEVNQVTPPLLLFENLNDRKHLHHDVVFHILDNVAIYLDSLPLESNIPPWAGFLQQLDLFLRKFLLTLSPGPIQLDSILQIILCVMKLPVIKEAKSILDPFSKILSHAIQHSSLDYHQLSELCTVCNKNVRDRDKQLLTRTAVFELVQAMKFKTSIPDANLLTLVQFVLTDCGGRLAPNVILECIPVSTESQSTYKTLAGECMQQYLNDALEFVADIHTLNKVKNMLYGNSTHLNEETLGGHLKAGISQYLAIEFSKNNGRDNRAISRYLPWLYHAPTTLQQGPKDFIDCVSHIRLLSWLLLGALIHSALMQTPSACQPIPLEANGHIAEHIQVILAGFSEQSKVSVLHMSSLFHAFILCQLWTMYCEHMVALNPPGSEQNQVCGLTLTDFWAMVTPGILQLVFHSKVEEYPQLAEMVSLHFLSLMEALQECNSTVLARLLPMWTPVLYSFQGHLSNNLHMRLQACVSCRPPTRSREETAAVSTTFLRWLQRLQFKMSQIELQSSTATQFYSL